MILTTWLWMRGGRGVVREQRHINDCRSSNLSLVAITTAIYDAPLTIIGGFLHFHACHDDAIIIIYLIEVDFVLLWLVVAIMVWLVVFLHVHMYPPKIARQAKSKLQADAQRRNTYYCTRSSFEFCPLRTWYSLTTRLICHWNLALK